MNTQNTQLPESICDDGSIAIETAAHTSCEASREAGWEAIEAQLNHWAEMDAEYWRVRKEREYKAWMKRTYGV